MSRFMPEKLFIEESVRELPLARQLVERCAGIPHETVPDARELIKAYQGKRRAAFDGKKQLLVARNRGRFLEPCPGTRNYICCGYMILTPGMGCPLDCSYCVLQAYLNNPFLTLYANLDDMARELEAHLARGPGPFVRIGTGEFMDSLALDHLTDFTRFILPFFKKKGIVLELKTKTINIENLAALDHGGAFIVSWSLNAPEITAREELGAAPVPDRIEAARQLIDRGYRVGFHFDPLVYCPGWEEGYCQTVSLLAARIPPEAIAWISIGSFRYMPHLKSIGLTRFPETKIFSQEFVPGLDGKMRYLQEIRTQMYEKMVSWLRADLRDVFIYFCMEHPAVWKKALGFVPGAKSPLGKMLDERIRPAP